MGWWTRLCGSLSTVLEPMLSLVQWSRSVDPNGSIAKQVDMGLSENRVPMGTQSPMAYLIHWNGQFGISPFLDNPYRRIHQFYSDVQAALLWLCPFFHRLRSDAKCQRFRQVFRSASILERTRWCRPFLHPPVGSYSQRLSTWMTIPGCVQLRTASRISHCKSPKNSWPFLIWWVIINWCIIDTLLFIWCISMIHPSFIYIYICSYIYTCFFPLKMPSFTGISQLAMEVWSRHQPT